MTTTTKIAGEAMTNEQIDAIWDQTLTKCDGHISHRAFARALLASKAAGPQAVERKAPYLPCPICKGIEGCDHPVPERKRAAEKAIYQNRVEGFESAWRDVSKETFDECSAIKTFETRIVYSAPQPVRQTASAAHIVLTGEQKIALDTGIAAMRRCGWHYYTPILKQMLAASPTAPAQSCGDAEQADEAVTRGAADGGHVNALEWHWSTSDEGPMYACGTDDVTESLAHALYESGIATFGEDPTSIFLCRFRPLKIDWKHHAEWLLEHIDDTVIDHVAEDAVPTEKTDVDALSTALASVVKVDASVAYDQCEFAPGDEKYETALLRVRNDAARKDSK
jgi:hypothetical protein